MSEQRLGPAGRTFTLPCCDGCRFLVAGFGYDAHGTQAGHSCWYALCAHPGAVIPREGGNYAPTIQKRWDHGRRPVPAPDWCPEKQEGQA